MTLSGLMKGAEVEWAREHLDTIGGRGYSSNHMPLLHA